MGIIQQRDEMVAEYCGGKHLTADGIRQHFAHHLPVRALDPLPKPCADCAVTGGLYHQVAALLSILPPDEVQFHSDRWFCHNHGDKACRGNANYQRIVAASDAQRRRAALLPHDQGGTER